VPAGLPQADNSAGGVVNDGLAGDTRELEWRRDDAGPQIAGLYRRVVGALDRQVWDPARRPLAVAQPGDVLSVSPEHAITVVAGQRRGRPVEYRGVEA